MKKDYSEKMITECWKKQISTPKISICCITYNHENYIADALDSFLLQKTDFPFEIIIRDDASTDNTAEIIKTYEKKFPNIIKPIYETINGFSRGIRPLPATFEYAKGEYIAVCEGDDMWNDPLKLQKQIDFLDANQEYVITYHNIVGLNEEGEFPVDMGGALRDLEARELQQCTPIYTLTTCFRNIFAEYPKEHYCSRLGDLFLWSMLGNHGKGKFLADIKPAKYRIHDGGIFSKKSKKEKYEMALITDMSLFAYYERTKNKNLMIYFKYKMIDDWILSESQTSLLKYLYHYRKNRLKNKLLTKLKKFRLIR